jgi:signal transduction histidine kinase
VSGDSPGEPVRPSALANLRHELRTPLNHIIGYSDMLQEEAEERGIKDFTPDLRKIQAAGQQLLSLITDVLDLSTIEAGEMKVHLETFDVSSLIQDVVLETGPLAAKNANRLEVHSAEAVGTMRADRTKIRQCLLNLLSNACKFTERGTIILDVTREKMNGGDWITFRVSDTGIGISPEQIDKLFQVFSQIDASSTRKYGGTGLGLVICRKFCQMMGGDITVQSAVGQGSIITIRLPAEVVASTVLKAEVSNACQQASI